MTDPTPTVFSELLTTIIALNEVGDVEIAFRLSHAGTANSGYSLGVFQLDLAHQTEARETVENFLAGTGVFGENDMSIISHGFLATGNAKAIAPLYRSAIDGQIATRNGRAMVNSLDAGQLQTLLQSVGQALGNARANPRYGSDDAFRAFSDSVFFQALIADNANQYGPPLTFGRFIQGQTVTVGGDALALGSGAWDFRTFAAYEAHYSYVRASEQGAADMRRRRANVVNALDQNGVLGYDKADCLATIQDIYQAVG